MLWLTGHSVKNQATEKLRSPSPPTQDTEELKQQNTLASSNQAAARRKLEQVVVAISRYSSRTGPLSNDVYSPDGRPLLSWRVVILPELGLEALHCEFRFDEPWDGENNRKLFGCDNNNPTSNSTNPQTNSGTTNSNNVIGNGSNNKITPKTGQGNTSPTKRPNGAGDEVIK